MITLKSNAIKTATIAAVACLMLATPSQAMGLLFHRLHQTPGLPAGAQPMSAQQLYELYVGKTWKWGAGGGYFGPNGYFRARTLGDKGESNAGGTWAVNNKGRMCFRATWVDSSGTSRANTCFDHAIVGADIYQRRLGSDEWYVFRHGVADPNDEYNKLVGENLAAVLAGK